MGSRPDVLQQLTLHAHELVDVLDHVHRDADGARLVGQGARDGLPDPPGGVRGELEAAPVVELLDGAHEAEVALLDEVEERHAAAHVPPGDGDDQAQVGLGELALGVHVAALDALGQRDLFLGGEQRHPAHLAKVHAHGIVGGGLHREVELGGRLLFDDGLRIGGDALALDDVDAEVGEDAVDLLELFRREVDVAQRGGDVRAVEVALLATFFEQHSHLVGAEHGEVGGRGGAVFSGFDHSETPALRGVLGPSAWPVLSLRRRAEHVRPLQMQSLVPVRAGAVKSGRQADR